MTEVQVNGSRKTSVGRCCVGAVMLPSGDSPSPWFAYL
jgi:hypothetical protein